MTSITGGTRIPTFTTDSTTLNRQETYDLRDAVRYGDQLTDVLGDLIAARKANGDANVDTTATVEHRNLHPDDDSIQDLIQRAFTEGGPLANFLDRSTLASAVRSGQALTFDEASALLDQVKSWSSTVRDSLPGSKHSSGLIWDKTTHSFSLDGRRVSLFEAYSEIRLKQADEIQTALAYRANSLDLRNRNIRSLNDIQDKLQDFIASGAWDNQDAIDLGDRLYSYVHRGTLGGESYGEYITRVDRELQALTGVSLEDQLESQGITSFYGADDPDGQISRTHLEAIVEAIDKQRESLENDNAIAAQQNQAARGSAAHHLHQHIVLHQQRHRCGRFGWATNLIR